MDLGKGMKDASDALQQVQPMAETLLALLSTPVGWLVAVGVFVWLLVNKDVSHLFALLERKERRRLEHLDRYVSKPDLADADSMKVLKDLRDAHFFKIATGIYAEKCLRAALIRLYGGTSHLVSWREIRRALPYIDLNDQGIITIRGLTVSEKFGYWYNEIIAIVLFFAAAGITASLLLSGSKNVGALFFGLGTTLLVALFAIFVSSQNWPVRAAKRIEAELSKQKMVDRGRGA